MAYVANVIRQQLDEHERRYETQRQQQR